MASVTDSIKVTCIFTVTCTYTSKYLQTEILEYLTLYSCPLLVSVFISMCLVLQTLVSETRSVPVPVSPAPPVQRWSRRRRRTPTERSTAGRRAPATSKPTASLVLRKVTPSPLPSPHTFPAPGPSAKSVPHETNERTRRAVLDRGWETQSCDCLRLLSSAVREGSLHLVILSALHLFTLFFFFSVCGSVSNITSAAWSTLRSRLSHRSQNHKVLDWFWSGADTCRNTSSHVYHTTVLFLSCRTLPNICILPMILFSWSRRCCVCNKLSWLHFRDELLSNL